MQIHAEFAGNYILCDVQCHIPIFQHNISVYLSLYGPACIKRDFVWISSALKLKLHQLFKTMYLGYIVSGVEAKVTHWLTLSQITNH